MKIEKTTTGCIIKEPSDEIKRKVLQYFSLKQPVREFFIYSGNDPDRRPIFGHERDVLYISSGFLNIEDDVIRRETKWKKEITPSNGRTISLGSTREPRSELQKDCIKVLTTSNSHKITCELKPGVGKTFIALYSISKLGLKPLIVAPTTLLKSQWTDEFINEGIPKEDITNNIYEAPSHKFCVVTITSLENALRDDWNGLMKVIKQADFGIKIIDEAHLHLKGILKFDALCNIKRNWYLSATLGRSDEMEDKILNRSLLDAQRFVGSSKYVEYQKEYINVYLQDCYYNLPRQLCDEYFKYGTKGLIKPTYYNALMAYQGGVPFISNIFTVYKRMKAILPEEVRNKKAIILVPMIRIMEKLIEEMKKDPYFDNTHVVAVDGRLKIAEKMANLDEGELILSTSQSLGTGVDVKNLSLLINFDQYSSPIISEQIVGRNRDRGYECYHVDVMDVVKYAKTFQNWGRERRSVLQYFPGVHKQFKMLPDLRK